MQVCSVWTDEGTRRKPSVCQKLSPKLEEVQRTRAQAGRHRERRDIAFAIGRNIHTTVGIMNL